VIEHMLNGIAF